MGCCRQDRRPWDGCRGTWLRSGSGVTRFKPGDEVFGGRQAHTPSTPRPRRTQLALKPANLTFEQAATVPMAGLVALQAIRDHGKVRAGQTVLINGASGGIGTFAVQIAKALGAEVTAVASTRNLDLLRSVGADDVIDYMAKDFTSRGEAVRRHCRPRLHPLAVQPAPALTPGRAHPNGGNFRKPMVRERGPAHPCDVPVPVRHAAPRAVPRSTDHADLVALKALIEAGKVTPVLDRIDPWQRSAGDRRRRSRPCAGEGRDHRVRPADATRHPAYRGREPRTTA